MHLKKTAVATAIAALSIPAAAEAAKPANPGAQGEAKAEQQRSAKAQKKQSKSQRVGFTFAGTGLTGQSGSTLLSPFTLDLVSANKHARLALTGLEGPEVTKSFINGTGTFSFPVAEGDTFTLKLDESIVDGGDEGSDVSLADVLATDRVKVIGKVVRTRTKARGSKPVFTFGAIDIRKIIITREADENENENETETQPTTQGS